MGTPGHDTDVVAGRLFPFQLAELHFQSTSLVCFASLALVSDVDASPNNYRSLLICCLPPSNTINNLKHEQHNTSLLSKLLFLSGVYDCFIALPHG